MSSTSPELDALERRYAQIYPLAALGRIQLQFFSTLIVVASSLWLAVATYYLWLLLTGADGTYTVSLSLASTAGALIGMCIGGSYWIILNFVNRMSKIAAVGWWIVAVLVLYVNWPSLASVLAFLAEAIDPDATQIALAISLLALNIYFIWLVPIALLRGGYALLSSSDTQRGIMREVVPGGSAGKRLITYLGLPPLAGFIVNARARYAKVVALTALSGLLLTSATLGALMMPSALSHTYVHSALHSPQFLWMVAALPFGMAGILLVVISIGREFERSQLRAMRFSLEELQKADDRQPILFLRAFADDQVNLVRPALPHLGRVLEYGRRRTNLDQIVLEEGTPYGPVVALGNPNDTQPPYGAARGYFSHKSWQQAVEELARASSVIVLCVDASEGVWWEVEHLAATHQLSKTLLLVHPAYQATNANAQLIASLSSRLELEPVAAKPLRRLIAAVETRSILAVRFDKEGVPELWCSSTFSRFAYLLALRKFLRANLGIPA